MVPDKDDAMLAAARAIAAASDPLRTVMENPLFPRGKDGAVAVWALNKGFELTADQVATLGGALDLFLLSLAQPANDTFH